MHLGIDPFVYFLLIFPGEYPVMDSSLLRSRYTRNHLAPVVQIKLDSAIHRINHNPVDIKVFSGETNCTIHWIEIYPLDSAIHLFNNWGQISTARISRSNDNEISFLNKSAHASHEIDEAFSLTYRKYFVFAENSRQKKTT